jgi:hypothetical protein
LNQRMFGGGPSAPQQPAPIADSSNALQAGSNTMPSTPDATGAMVNQGGVGPTVQNAAALSAIVPQSAPQQPSQGGIAGNFFSLPGMNPQTVRMAYALDPENTMKTILSQYSPSDLTKMGIQAGHTPDQIRADNAAGIVKANNLPPTRLGPNVYYDPRHGIVGVPTGAGPGTTIVNRN